MTVVTSVAVFCGSADGRGQQYRTHAELVGRTLAEKGITLVTGGGRVGLMGAIANAALAAGGQVIGVMPRHLVEREIAHGGLSRLEVVETMHERKAQMAELSDAFIALPGGAGTLEELFEQWTWAQLALHRKPSAVLNVAGYYDPLRSMVIRCVDEGFLRPEYRDMLSFHDDIDELLAHIAAYKPPTAKWGCAL